MSNAPVNSPGSGKQYTRAEDAIFESTVQNLSRGCGKQAKRLTDEDIAAMTRELQALWQRDRSQTSRDWTHPDEVKHVKQSYESYKQRQRNKARSRQANTGGASGSVIQQAPPVSVHQNLPHGAPLQQTHRPVPAAMPLVGLPQQVQLPSFRDLMAHIHSQAPPPASGPLPNTLAGQPSSVILRPGYEVHRSAHQQQPPASAENEQHHRQTGQQSPNPSTQAPGPQPHHPNP